MNMRDIKKRRALLDEAKERLRAALERANANHEEFERRWYLVSDENDRLRAALAEALGAWEALSCCYEHKPDWRIADLRKLVKP